MMISPSVWLSAGSTQPSCRPLSSSVPPASARKPSGSGFAIGRSVMRVRASGAGGGRLRRYGAHDATTSACGAASFMRLRAHVICIAVSPSHALNHCQQLAIARALRGLADERPRDVALAGHEVEVMQVAQQAERAVARAAEDLAVEAVGLAVRVLAVALGEGPELLGVAVALRRELLADRVDVVLVGVTVRHRPEGIAELCL